MLKSVVAAVAAAALASLTGVAVALTEAEMKTRDFILDCEDERLVSIRGNTYHIDSVTSDKAKRVIAEKKFQYAIGKRFSFRSTTFKINVRDPKPAKKYVLPREKGKFRKETDCNIMEACKEGDRWTDALRTKAPCECGEAKEWRYKEFRTDEEGHRIAWTDEEGHRIAVRKCEGCPFYKYWDGQKCKFCGGRINADQTQCTCPEDKEVSIVTDKFNLFNHCVWKYKIPLDTAGGCPSMFFKFKNKCYKRETYDTNLMYARCPKYYKANTDWDDNLYCDFCGYNCV